MLVPDPEVYVAFLSVVPVSNSKVGIPLAVAMVTGNPFLGIITAVKCGTYGKVN